MTISAIDRARYFRPGAAVHSDVDRAIARADLVRKLQAARRTERALRDELLDAGVKVGFATLALEDFDAAGRAP